MVRARRYEFRGIQSMEMCFSLYGLIEFQDNPSSNEIVAKELMKEYVWAKVKITSHEFYAERCKHKPIPANLYDSMRHYACMNIISRWNITHILGVTLNIYCHVNKSVNDLKYVRSMILAFVEHGPRYYYDIEYDRFCNWKPIRMVQTQRIFAAIGLFTDFLSIMAIFRLLALQIFTFHRTFGYNIHIRWCSYDSLSPNRI